MVLISIVVPVYNVAPYLKQCIESILTQNFNDYELLLINDGSTDLSGTICNEYAKKYEQIKVQHSLNEGAGPARNKGIEMASGKYILFIDPDDWMEPYLLSDMYQQIESQGVDLLLWSLQAMIYNSKGEFIKTKVIQAQDLHLADKKQCEQQFIEIAMWDDLLLGVPWNKLYRMDLINKYHIRFPKLRRRQDIIFNIDYYKHISSLITTSRVYSNYRVIDTGYANKVPQNYYDTALYVYGYFKEALEQWGEYTPDVRKHLDQYFINDVMNIIGLCMNPKWDWGLRDKYQYIKNIMQKPDVKAIVQNTEDPIKTNTPGYKLRMLKLKYLKKQNYFKMLILNITEDFIKKRRRICQTNKKVGVA